MFSKNYVFTFDSINVGDAKDEMRGGTEPCAALPRHGHPEEFLPGAKPLAF